MADNEKMATVKVVMSSGQEHQFEMTMEKASAFGLVVTNVRENKARKWIDVLDYTDGTSGQALLNRDLIEFISIGL